MNYNQLLDEVKKLFAQHLQKVVTQQAYNANPLISHNAYLDIIYTEIMALGYNFGDIVKATDDIYEMKSAFSDVSLQEIQEGVKETSKHYESEIGVFSEFHRSTQNGVSFDKALENVATSLQSIS